MTQKKLSLLMEAYIASPQVPFKPPIEARKPDVLPIVPSERWAVIEKKRISKLFRFSDIDARNTFVTQLLRLESDCGHNAQLLIDENDVKVTLWTRASDSLTELDKEFARVADSIYKDITCPLPSIYIHNTVG